MSELSVAVAETAIAAQDADLALWATEVVPDSDTLHRLTLQGAAVDRHNPDRLTQAWAAVNRALQSTRTPPDAALVELYHNLRQARTPAPRP